MPDMPASRAIRAKRRLWRRRLRRLRQLGQDQRGQTMLEWTLLLAAIAIPSYAIVYMGVQTLTAHYEMVTTLNGLPFP